MDADKLSSIFAVCLKVQTSLNPKLVQAYFSVKFSRYFVNFLM